MDSDITVAYLGLGSNLGDRAGNLLLAVRSVMEASFVVNKLSAIYETEPVGMVSDSMFLNMVAEIHVRQVSASQMMARLLRIEYLLGRGDKSVKKPRTVDLDILFFGDQVIRSEFLTVPHPRLHTRKFVLCPMSEIAPNFQHPIAGLDMSEMLKDCPDTSRVERWNPNAGVPREAMK